MLTPRSDPAATIWYPGASSAKYLRDSRTFGVLWISSNMRRVSPGVILVWYCASRELIMRFVS